MNSSVTLQFTSQAAKIRIHLEYQYKLSMYFWVSLLYSECIFTFHMYEIGSHAAMELCAYAKHVFFIIQCSTIAVPLGSVPPLPPRRQGPLLKPLTQTPGFRRDTVPPWVQWLCRLAEKAKPTTMQRHTVPSYSKNYHFLVSNTQFALL